jgi:hypothetical protein
MVWGVCWRRGGRGHLGSKPPSPPSSPPPPAPLQEGRMSNTLAVPSTPTLMYPWFLTPLPSYPSPLSPPPPSPHPPTPLPLPPPITGGPHV